MLPQKAVRSIQFGLFNPSLVHSLSVCHVTCPETYDHGIPMRNGLSDLRMGTISRDYLCSTCNNDCTVCPGHFGHIDLVKPMYHVGYLQNIRKVLESVCFYCSRIRKKSYWDDRETRSLDKVWRDCKTKMVCDDCNNKQPLIKKEGLVFYAFMRGEESTDGRVMLNGDKVNEIFFKIRDDEAARMGFDPRYSRPEDMIIKTLVVCPPCVRPSIIADGLRSEDDLTYKYSDIIKSNQNLRKYEEDGAPAHIIRDYEQLVQFHISTLINNEISGQPQAIQKNGRPLKSISNRLKGKEGRFRGNLMGKRVDYSSRSVITPDPNIKLNELGVPRSIAMTQTFAEPVTAFNKERLDGLVRNGPFRYPGANYVIRGDGTRVDLKYSNVLVEHGWTVERHIVDGDVVLFNRQPSLHKMSMMAHRVKVMNGRTFRLNLSATTPYNADFDGDEMNMHTPQSYNSVSELDNLTSVKMNVVSPQSSKPVIGIVQDTLLGVYRMTRYSFLTASEFNQLRYGIYPADGYSAPFPRRQVDPPAILQPIVVYTGKQLFSSITPCINYDASGTIIRNGVLVTGTIDKKAVGSSTGSLIHIINNDFGPETVSRFIDDLQRVVNGYLTYISSFSVGIGDTISSDPEWLRSKLDLRPEAELGRSVSEIIGMSKRKGADKLPGMSLRETFESRLAMLLNKVRDSCGSICSASLNYTNYFKQMVLAGSKGSIINVSQVTSCVGQQNVEGGRIPFGFNKRTLPHFVKNDYGPRSKGFVTNSYLTGLIPEEFFFHAMGGREGLIDTACKTSETGYIQRRIVKALEDYKTYHDGSVRSTGMLVEYAYGDDLYDSTFLEYNTLPPIPTGQPSSSSDEEMQFISSIYEKYEKKSVALPINFKRLINRCKEKFAGCRVDVNELVNLRENLVEFAKKCYRGVDCSTLSDFIRYFLSPIIWNDGSNGKDEGSGPRSCELLSSLEERMRSLMLRGRIAHDEMVGVLAAQSIGEPATQMTLNTFHYAGVAQNVTQGVPRLKEIINCIKNIRTPMHRIYLESVDMDDGSVELDAARRISSAILYTNAEQLLKSYSIVYDPVIEDTVLEEDKELVRAYYEFPDEVVPNLNPWLLRLVVDRCALVSKNVEFSSLVEIIKQAFKSDIFVMSSDENDTNLVIRIRIVGEADEPFYRKLADTIKGIYIKGVDGVSKVYLTRCDSEHRAPGVSEWMLQTDGSNFRKVLSVSGTIPSLTYCNDLFEVLSVLGIEAVRECLLRELVTVIENEGSYINHRHLFILCDTMTMKGLKGITRHGINRTSYGALKRSSFEQTIEILLDAACFAENNYCMGVTESIMLGQVSSAGTGNCCCVLNSEKLARVPQASVQQFEFEETIPIPPASDDPISLKGSDADLFLLSPVSMSGSPTAENSGQDLSQTWSPLAGGERVFSPLSPMFNATTTEYRPGTTPIGRNIPTYSPTSPAYSPTSPAYSPTSPAYSPTSPAYSPTSPAYSPTSPAYSPTSPVNPSYSPQHGRYDEDDEKKRIKKK